MVLTVLETRHSERVLENGQTTRDTIDDLVSKIRTSLELAMTGQGKLDPRILTMSGMSGQRYRLFINNLVSSLSDARYLEVGSWAGSTLCSAINGNSVRASAIDNWSEFGGPKEEFSANLHQFRTPRAYVNFIEMDFRDVSFSSIGPFNVYLFDGPHSSEDHYHGLKLALPALDDEFIFIVDDWNWLKVQNGTRLALSSCGLEEHYSVQLQTTLNNTQPELQGQHSEWHNGYYIAVLSKSVVETAS